MTLKALFAIPIVVILLVTLSLAGMTVSQEWAGHSRGALAIAATDRAGLLTELEQHLSKERTVTWKAFEADYPLPERMRAELENTRTETVQAINAMIVMLAREAREGGTQSGIPAEFPHAVLASLLQARARSDALLSIEPRWRSHEALSSVMPVMLGPSVLFGPLLARAGIELIDAEPELAGTIVVARIGLQLREELVAISSVMLPRINAREKPSEAELDQVRSLLAQADVTARIMEVTFYLTNPSPVMRTALARANAAREATIQWQLDKAIDAGPLDARINRPIVWLSWPIEYWAARVNDLRIAIIDEAAERAHHEQVLRTRRLDLALTAVGAVVLIILAARFVLQRRVVAPLAQLGFAITRIAGGDRREAFVVHSTTREIATMVTAVETLRQAALVADATATRQREAADRRRLVLREVLGILRVVYEPSHAVEGDVAKLSAGLDAAMALVGGRNKAPPPTLEAAALAVRTGLRGIHEAARDLDAAIVAAREAEDNALPEAEIVKRILRVRGLIDRRDTLVRAFIQPCLRALRDLAPEASDPEARSLHELISDQFELIEATVGAMAMMLSAVTKAATIVRELPVEAEPLAA